MENMIITEYGRPVSMNKVKNFVHRTIPLEDEKVIPCALFALLDNGEIVNIGNFYDSDTAEIIRILLDVFSTDKKMIFNINLEAYGVKEFLKLLKYVTGSSYPIAVESLKTSLANGDFDVSFT